MSVPFGIVIFYGGEIISSPQIGVDYSLSSRFTLEGNKSTTFEQLKSTIYQTLGLDSSEFSIEMQCRINIGQPGYFYFDLISIYDESSWRIARDMCVRKMGLIQLYVKMNPITNNPVFSGNEPSSNNQHSPVISQSPPTPIVPGSVNMHIDNENDQHNSDYDGGSDDDESDDEDYVKERGESESSSSEDIDGKLPVGEDDEDEIVDVAVSRREQYNPFIGLGETHPTSSVHDTRDFRPADYSLYGPRVSVDGPIAENQTFSSKEHLIFALSKWHIEKNREFVVLDSSTTKYRVKCKDPNCDWRLYGKAVGNS